ncbi:DUF5673 domain-containing protein [Hathewaya limosa]|uniref:DUF5673 domain-containing protein n=1 Tax=Hathewaya limosa TaxID=1536 RepID=A0ABU0JPC4_HATLI|nr:DUF5673 domain-containing protein [Hathewaya limosa]MDQ0478937.1 hypothetical protein [Hathewaya limosa]
MIMLIINIVIWGVLIITSARNFANRKYLGPNLLYDKNKSLFKIHKYGFMIFFIIYIEILLYYIQKNRMIQIEPLYYICFLGIFLILVSLYIKRDYLLITEKGILLKNNCLQWHEIKYYIWNKNTLKVVTKSNTIFLKNKWKFKEKETINKLLEKYIGKGNYLE